MAISFVQTADMLPVRTFASIAPLREGCSIQCMLEAEVFEKCAKVRQIVSHMRFRREKQGDASSVRSDKRCQTGAKQRQTSAKSAKLGTVSRFILWFRWPVPPMRHLCYKYPIQKQVSPINGV